MKKILLVDDHQLIFGGLSSALQDYSLDYAGSVEEAFGRLNETSYNAAVLDISIGDKKGFDLVKHIPSSCAVYFLTMHKSSVYIMLARELGARGYFLKDEPPDLMVKALNRPLERRFWMSPSVEQELESAKPSTGSNYEKLSPREQQIFSMLAEDLSYIEIARRLGLSRKTVNNHRDHIMKKLEIRSQVGLVKEAIRLGIITIS